MILLVVIQMIIGILLVASILIQMQGTGLSGAFGGGGDVYRSKRSVEKFLVIATILLAFLFGVFSIFLLIPR